MDKVLDCPNRRIAVRGCVASVEYFGIFSDILLTQFSVSVAKYLVLYEVLDLDDLIDIGMIVCKSSLVSHSRQATSNGTLELNVYQYKL